MGGPLFVIKAEGRAAQKTNKQPESNMDRISQPSSSAVAERLAQVEGDPYTSEYSDTFLEELQNESMSPSSWDAPGRGEECPRLGGSISQPSGEEKGASETFFGNFRRCELPRFDGCEKGRAPTGDNGGRVGGQNPLGDKERVLSSKASSKAFETSPQRWPHILLGAI